MQSNTTSNNQTIINSDAPNNMSAGYVIFMVCGSIATFSLLAYLEAKHRQNSLRKVPERIQRFLDRIYGETDADSVSTRNPDSFIDAENAEPEINSAVEI